MADRLTRLLHYTDVTVLEKEDRVAGKAHSIAMLSPCPPDNPEQAICELGTCYMSPAYDELVTFLRPFTDPRPDASPNDRQLPAQPTGRVRGMVTTGMIKGFPNVVDYTDYLVLRYQQKKGEKLDPGQRDVVLEKLGLLLGDYAAGQGWALIRRELPGGDTARRGVHGHPGRHLSSLDRLARATLADRVERTARCVLEPGLQAVAHDCVLQADLDVGSFGREACGASRRELAPRHVLEQGVGSSVGPDGGAAQRRQTGQYRVDQAQPVQRRSEERG